jgi:hypothetical protein
LPPQILTKSKPLQPVLITILRALQGETSSFGKSAIRGQSMTVASLTEH